jgi:type VI secretion system protein ImpL
MIQLMRLDDSLDTRTQLLRLELPVAPADPKDPVGKDKVVRVFAGLTLSEPGKTTPLTWPRVFPDRAPALDR